MEYLLELGEVQATQVVATLVDGIQGHANQGDIVDMIYLPMKMGYCSCYRPCMNSFGFKTRWKPNGGIDVDRLEINDRKKKPDEVWNVS